MLRHVGRRSEFQANMNSSQPQRSQRAQREFNRAPRPISRPSSTSSSGMELPENRRFRIHSSPSRRFDTFCLLFSVISVLSVVQ